MCCNINDFTPHRAGQHSVFTSAENRCTHVGKNKKGFIKFLLFTLIGLSVTTLGNFIGHNLLGGNVWLVKWIVILIVFVFNFFTRKYFIFNIKLIRDDEHTIKL